MSSYVCDYAWARPDPNAIKAAGFVAVCRYLSHDRTGKTLTLVEEQAIFAAGLLVVDNFEDSAGRMLLGASAGHGDAVFANQLADSLGTPKARPIYYSCDTDPGSPSSPQIQAYIRALVAAGGRPVGVYGGDELVRWALANGAQFGWWANASSWDHGVSGAGHMHQLYGHPAGTPVIPGVAGNQYDTSIVLQADFGGWSPNSTEGTLMALTDQQQQDLYAAATGVAHNLLQGIGHSTVDDLTALVRSLPTATQIAAAVVAALPPSQGGAVDVKALAAAVATELSARLAQ